MQSGLASNTRPCLEPVRVKRLFVFGDARSRPDLHEIHIHVTCAVPSFFTVPKLRQAFQLAMLNSIARIILAGDYESPAPDSAWKPS